MEGSCLPEAKRQKVNHTQSDYESDDDDKTHLAAILRGIETEQEQDGEGNTTNDIEERLSMQEYRITEIERKQEEYSLAMDQALEEVKRKQDNQARGERDTLLEHSRAMVRTMEDVRRENEKQVQEMRGIRVILEEQRKQQVQTNIALQSMLMVIKSTCGLVKSRADRKDEKRRCAQEEQASASASPCPSVPILEATPSNELPRQPYLTLIDSKICIPIRYDELNPGVYPPVEIPADDYDKLRRRCRTVTSFIRGLTTYFFTPEVLRRSNYAGTTVLTKDGRVKKDQLDRRLVMSMLDQAELEFPGEVQGIQNYVKIRDVINDKCRHS